MASQLHRAASALDTFSLVWTTDVAMTITIKAVSKRQKLTASYHLQSRRSREIAPSKLMERWWHEVFHKNRRGQRSISGVFTFSVCVCVFYCATVYSLSCRSASGLMFSFEPLIKRYWFCLITLLIREIHCETLNVPVNYWSLLWVKSS